MCPNLPITIVHMKEAKKELIFFDWIVCWIANSPIIAFHIENLHAALIINNFIFIECDNKSTRIVRTVTSDFYFVDKIRMDSTVELHNESFSQCSSRVFVMIFRNIFFFGKYNLEQSREKECVFTE